MRGASKRSTYIASSPEPANQSGSLFLLRHRDLRQYPHDLHHPVLHLQDLDRMVGDDEARARLGEVLELLEEEPGDGLRAVEREVEARLAVQHAQRARGVGDHAAVGLLLEERCAADRLAGGM